jgi:hypothetical protein
MHAEWLQDRDIRVLLESPASAGFLLAYERKKGRASRLWPYMCLLPKTPECVWHRPSREAAGLASVAQRAGGRPALLFVVPSAPFAVHDACMLRWRAGWSAERAAQAQRLCDDQRWQVNQVLLALSRWGVDRALGLTSADIKWGIATVRGAHACACAPLHCSIVRS